MTSRARTSCCPGPDPEPEDASEGSAPAGAGGASEAGPQHEHQVRGPSPLLPGPEDAGGHVSSRQLA